MEIQENLCFVGGIPIITKFAARQYSNEIRLEAAAFVRQMYQTSTLTLQMFVSAGGLNVLVEFLDEDYDEARDLVLIGVNGIWNVFELQVCMTILTCSTYSDRGLGTDTKERLLPYLLEKQDSFAPRPCPRSCLRRRRRSFGTHRRSHCEHLLSLLTGRELRERGRGRSSGIKTYVNLYRRPR